MSLTDYINSTLCVLSFVLSFISIVTAVKTLKQNNQMIESSTRPYICIYGDTLNFQKTCYFLVIKNFEKSGAIITDVSYYPFDAFEKQSNYKNKPFEHIKNTFFAPGQSLRFPLDYNELKNTPHGIAFTITYVSDQKEYIDKSLINLDTHLDTYSLKASTPDEDLKIISYTFQEMVERSI